MHPPQFSGRVLHFGGVTRTVGGKNYNYPIKRKPTMMRAQAQDRSIEDLAVIHMQATLFPKDQFPCNW